MKNWNWIGWSKTIVVSICCALTLWLYLIEQNPGPPKQEMSFFGNVIIGVLLVLSNVLINKLFRELILEKPKWNDNPFNIKYPLRVYQFFGICLVAAGGLVFSVCIFKFPQLSKVFHNVFGLGFGILAGVFLLLKLRKPY